jgi:hypothetical protein
MCISKFEIEEDRRASINEYLSHEEKQAEQEEKDSNTNHLEPINDNDEEENVGDDVGDDVEGGNDVVLDNFEPLGEKAQGKRRQSIAL